MPDRLEKEFEQYKANFNLFTLAKELIGEYILTSKIPARELKKAHTGFNEDELIASCRLAEDKANEVLMIH